MINFPFKVIECKDMPMDKIYLVGNLSEHERSTLSEDEQLTLLGKRSCVMMNLGSSREHAAEMRWQYDQKQEGK